ncbi:MAG: antibiotic biosynthesis monooxygenase, partial [Pseudomonadota bacterium]|nr:antibiotic biosynthesis monooxygenase [Pseudomonadota bacterium]
RYLEIADELRNQLENLDGFISIERFQSLNDEDRIVSLSFWRDETAIANWRANADHRQAQTVGRHELFKSYRIRIAEVLRDYSLTNRAEAPQAPPEISV